MVKFALRSITKVMWIMIAGKKVRAYRNIGKKPFSQGKARIIIIIDGIIVQHIGIAAVRSHIYYQALVGFYELLCCGICKNDDC